MEADPQVIAELRAMFKEGATPSRLLQHIRARHPNEEHWFSLVQQYFREAFSVRMVRVSNRPEDSARSDLRLAALNLHIVHEMIQNRSQWDHEAPGAEAASGSWVDSLTATDDVELIRQAQPDSLPEFARSWPHMEPAAQTYVQRLMGNVNSFYERTLVLARLAERLQQRVVELENQLQESRR